MKTVLKDFLIIAAILTAGLVCLNVFLSDNLSKKQIFKLVERNSAVIIEDISANNFDDTLSIKGIQEVSSRNGMIDFYCGGKGVGSATSYYGFYYSESDEPIGAFAGVGLIGNFELTPDGRGYSYREENSDNIYYTEKITEKFYYYESHF